MMKNSSKKFEGCEIPKELEIAMVNMMKYMVTNDWYNTVSNEEAFYWLSSGTGLSVSFIEKLIGDQSLYDEKFKAGRVANPFKEIEETKIKNKDKSDLFR